MALQIRVKKKFRGEVRDTVRDRSLGFVPLLLMTMIYLACTVFEKEIGPLTSAPGLYDARLPAPGRGCRMPRASE